MSTPIVQLKKILTESKIESNEPDVGKRLRVRLNCMGVEKRPDTNDKAGATKYYTRRSGQFVYGRQNLHKGAFGVVPEHLDGFESSADIPAFDVSTSCKPEWIELFLKQGGYYLELAKLASGVGSQRISPTKFLALEIPLPTISEQELILRKVDGFLSNQVQLFGELTHQQTLLKKLRQQILQEAIEGKLTADWRAENPDVEPASELLKRIAAEKAELVKAKKIKKQKALPPISDEEIRCRYPDSWGLTRLGIVSDVRGGITKNSTKRAGHKLSLPYLRVANVYANRLELNEIKEIGLAESEVERYSLQDADLLVVEGNGSRDQVGRIALWDGSIEPCLHQNHLINVRMIDKELHEWALYFYLSPFGREILEQQARTSTGLYNLSTGKISNLPFFLPSVDEQRIIVLRIKELLVICDQLETQIAQNQTHADALMQAVLREAFTQGSPDKTQGTANA